MIRVLLLACLCLCAAARVPRPLGCGFLNDGTSDRFDVDVQWSQTELSGAFYGFIKPGDHVVRHEMCAVSEKMVTQLMLATDPKERCSTASPLSASPDVADWNEVDDDSVHIFRGLTLAVGVRYFLVMRTTYSDGLVMYTNSDGVKVTEAESQQETSPSATVLVQEELVASTTNTTPKRAGRDVEETEQAACPIDVANLCRAGKVNVGEFLTELYGPPVWSLNDKNRDVLLTSLPSIDSGSGLSDGDRAGIIVGVVIFALLLLLIILLLVFAKGRRKDNKFQTVLYRDENLELEDGVEYKQQRQTEKDSVSSQSKVIFPEMKIRRLSQGDARPIYDDEDTGGGGGAKRLHPAMDVQSSSLRDYRQQA